MDDQYLSQSNYLTHTDDSNNASLVINPSRLTSSTFPVIQMIDPARAPFSPAGLVEQPRQGSFPNWISKAMIKSGKVNNPASQLLTIRYGQTIIRQSTIRFLKPSAQSPVNVNFPLPSKVKSALLLGDISKICHSFRKFSISINAAPPPIPTNPSPAPLVPRVPLRSCSFSVSSSHQVKFYIPVRYISYGKYKMVNGFHVGTFSAYDPIKDNFAKFICEDHGQFPWGHSSRTGTMAELCKSLGIKRASNACNTCLPLHLFICLMDRKIISFNMIISKYAGFVKSLLNTSHMRDGYPTLKKVFSKLKLYNKACVYLIDRIESNSFTILNRHVGTIDKETIYIVHVPWHFFRARKLDL